MHSINCKSVRCPLAVCVCVGGRVRSIFWGQSGVWESVKKQALKKKVKRKKLKEQQPMLTQSHGEKMKRCKGKGAGGETKRQVGLGGHKVGRNTEMKKRGLVRCNANTIQYTIQLIRMDQYHGIYKHGHHSTLSLALSVSEINNAVQWNATSV